jgi:hypothetical protein
LGSVPILLANSPNNSRKLANMTLHAEALGRVLALHDKAPIVEGLTER